MHAWGFGLIYKRTCSLILCTLRVLYSLSLSLPAYFIESHMFYHKNMKSDIPTQSSTHKKIQKQLFSFHVLRKVSTFSRPGWHSWMVGSAMQSMYLILPDFVGVIHWLCFGTLSSVVGCDRSRVYSPSVQRQTKNSSQVNLGPMLNALFPVLKHNFF